ncbi:MAG: LysR family transcriptional regulator [Acidimicrobiales bacterium]
MTVPEQLRTFVAVYRARSVTDGARERRLSQPAASQQLARLEQAVGRPLFVRTPKGVEPTGEGVALYAESSAAVDQLEAVVDGLGAGGPTDGGAAALRVGSTAEYFAAAVLPRVERSDRGVVASFGADGRLLEQLERGELDVAVVSSAPSRRSLAVVPVEITPFVLVVGAGLAPDGPLATVAEVGDWLVPRPWVAYSLELPITRRFWQSHLGRPFSARLRLVAPDLRAVAAAVERGLGCSILPRFVCRAAFDEGTMAEVYPVAGLIPGQPWFVCARAGDIERPAVSAFVALMAA